MDDPRNANQNDPDHFYVDSFKTLQVLVNPLRLKIIECLREPRTVKSVAQSVNVKPSNLYYHFNQLRAHGLIRIEREEGRTRYFRASARRYRLNWKSLAPDEAGFARRFEQTLGGIFIGSIEDARTSIVQGLVEIGENPTRHRRLLLNSGRSHLTEERAKSFYSKLEALIEEYGFDEYDAPENEDGEATQIYRIFMLLHPSSRDFDRRNSA
ncbi:MAG: ArsR family transcriptional regulator [Anaerolineaceae bacterium]|nr:MAG: ArsR family transcriptional regulator [Anaerolineaceae bacterium]